VTCCIISVSIYDIEQDPTLHSTNQIPKPNILELWLLPSLSMATQSKLSMITAEEALNRLQAGNKRFASGNPNIESLDFEKRRAALIEGQAPFAVILGCSDSRVPAEIVFDQGLGDLFVIRVAGNIVAPSQIGSIEFAVESFGTPLVVVLGHSNCGAVSATLDSMDRPRDKQSSHLYSIVDRVRPSLEPLLATNLRNDREALLTQAVRANISASANHIRKRSPILEQLHQNGKLLVVGAKYSLETGVVDFFDGMPS